MRLVIVMLIGAGACGRARFRAADDAAPDAEPADVPIDAPDAAVTSVGPDAGPCNLAAPFGPPIPVSALNSGGIDSQAALSPDLLDVYFMSDRLAGLQVFTASRSSPTAAFGTVAPLASLNFASADTWNVAITGDALTAYFVTDQSGRDRMYKATRASTLAGFATPKAMAAQVIGGEQPYVLPDDSALYYSDTNQGVIMRAALAPTLSTQVESALAVPLHSVGIPVVAPDELAIYFAVFDANVFESYDIWMARRQATSAPWSAPSRVSELDTAAFEVPSWISPDGCELYFTRAADAGHWSIYVARRP